jgi:hypothetical protein
VLTSVLATRVLHRRELRLDDHTTVATELPP